MRKLIFRAAASSDLRIIANSTKKRWGSEQAARYVGALRNQINAMRQFSERYPEVEQSYRGLRKMRSGHHLVYYLVNDDTLEIVRVLHERMDFEERLR